MSKPSLPALIFIIAVDATLAAAQSLDEPRLFTYVRVGTSAVMADDLRRAPAVGFGLRGEVGSFAVDISGLNFALNVEFIDPARELAVGSLLKLQGLKFFSPDRKGSAYIGGGASWGVVSVGRAAHPDGHNSSWGGSGLQGEFTIGYELPRSHRVRFLLQADASLPLFNARSESYSYPDPGRVVHVGSDVRVIPSVVLSFGVGWQR
jgi:hypothetical protein